MPNEAKVQRIVNVPKQYFWDRLRPSIKFVVKDFFFINLFIQIGRAHV